MPAARREPRGGRAWPLGVQPADGLALLLLVALAAFYFWRLDAWLINDDEGSYLYAAWRISLGELPYRDFLTPQLPAFLLPGGLLMHLAGPAVWPARALAVVLTLGACACVWATARRLFGPLVALLAGTALLLQPDVYLDCRTFRSEPFMLFFAALGIWLFARGVFPRPGADDPPDRRWLAAAGLAFGLALLSKLFGLLPLVGCGAWLLADGWRQRRPWRALATDGLVIVGPWVAIVAVGLGGFYLLTNEVYAAVVGHHLRQGAGLGPAAVLGKGVAFYATYLRYNANALLAFVAIVAAAAAWRERDRRAGLFAWQLPSALVFLALSRELWPRHLIYLVPALATLFALGVTRLAARDGEVQPPPAATTGPATRRWLAGALVAALLVPWLLIDRDSGWRWEDGTRRLADFIRLTTAADELVLSDYSEMDFYALRPTTYSGASLSAGAAMSGQITWQRLRGELDRLGREPALVVIDRTGLGGTEYGHLRFLRDLAAFEAWLATNYDLAGTFRRDPQDYRIYTPRARPLPARASFVGGPTLLAAGPDRALVDSGAALELVSLWRAEEETDDDLVQTVRLVDLGGVEWAQFDDTLRASRLRPTGRWQAGELTSDRLRLTVPLGTPPGEYELRLGLYRRDNLGRLDAVDPAGRPVGQSVAVGRVRVAPWIASPAEARRRLQPDRTFDDYSWLGGQLQLLGRGPLPAEPVEAGQVFPLELWWQATVPSGGGLASLTAGGELVSPTAGGGPATRPAGGGLATLGPGGEGVGPAEPRDVTGNLAVRLALVRSQPPDSGTVVAMVTVPLGVPGASSSSWPPQGLTVRQQVRVPIMADAADGRYRLLATVVDATGAPAGGQPAAGADLGEVTVVGRDMTDVVTVAPPVDHELEATLGDVAELVGADVPSSVAPGAALAVTLVWRAVAPAATAYKVTVQLLDEAGRVVAQHDGEPADWSRSTTGWLLGEIIIDGHTLAVPADLPPGRYAVLAGLYHPDTLVRLPATGSDSAGELVRVATVVVR